MLLHISWKQEDKCLCAFLAPTVKHGCLESTEAHTKPSGPSSSLNGGSLRPAVEGVLLPQFRCSPLTHNGPLQHTGKKHTTLGRYNAQWCTAAEACSWRSDLRTGHYHSRSVELRTTAGIIYPPEMCSAHQTGCWNSSCMKEYKYVERELYVKRQPLNRILNLSSIRGDKWPWRNLNLLVWLKSGLNWNGSSSKFKLTYWYRHR